MQKKNVIALVMITIGVALITTALVIVYIYYPPNRANFVDDNITDFFMI